MLLGFTRKYKRISSKAKTEIFPIFFFIYFSFQCEQRFAWFCLLSLDLNARRLCCSSPLEKNKIHSTRVQTKIIKIFPKA